MVLGMTGEAAWATKTAGEVRDVASADGSILLVPVGSLEQHGDHLPVATDSLLVTAVAELGIERTSGELPILATPTVWTGHSPHHLPFGGTVTLTARGFLDLLEMTVESALENGFDAVLLLNGHGGNRSLISTATSVIGTEHPNVEVTGLTYFQLATDVVSELRKSEIGGMVHGGEYETSLMLHLYPDLVDRDRLAGTNKDDSYDLALKDLMVGGSLSIYRPFSEYSETGAIGDPTVASAETGERIYDALGDELGDLLVEIHEQNRN